VNGNYNDRSDANFIIYTGSGANTGTIRVTSVPAVAAIWVDNEYMTGTTPYKTDTTGSTTLTLSAGSHNIGASCSTSLENYYPIPKTPVTIPLGGSAPDLNFQLDKVTTNSDCDPYGRLYVSSTPQDTRDAIVRIDGTFKGLKTDGETMIAPGSHTVSVEHNGYSTKLQTVTIPNPDCSLLRAERDERITYADFPLTAITDVIPTKILIIPQPLNIGRPSSYFVAFVTLPSSSKAADVVDGSVFCQGAPALKLFRDSKLFPQTFAAVFRRGEMVGVPTTGGKVTMSVWGVIKKANGNPYFRGIAQVQVINKKVTTKENIDDVLKWTLQQLFKLFK
jgi:hypothetical protein